MGVTEHILQKSQLLKSALKFTNFSLGYIEEKVVTFEVSNQFLSNLT